MSTPTESPRRLHPLTPFFGLVAFFRQAALPIAIAVFAGGDRTQLFLAIPVLVGTLFSVVAYLRFTYRIEGGAVIVDEGVLTRKQRVVPLDRIQQVDVVAKLMHRLLGVVTVKLDTASGGQGADVDLTVVSKTEAERLRAIVATKEPAAEAAFPQDGPPGAPVVRESESRSAVLVRLSAGELALAGVTGGRLLALIAVLGPLGQTIDELGDALTDPVAAVTAQRSGAVVGTIVITLLLAAWLLAAAGGSVLSYAGYTLSRRGADLHLACGLLDRRESSMPLERVQVVRIRQNILRRALGRASIRIQSGAIVGSRSVVDVPLLPVAMIDPLLATLLPGASPLPTLEPAPSAARRRALVRRIVPATLALAAGIAIVRPPLAVAVVVAVAVLAFCVLSGELHYRGLGVGTNGTVVVGREGGIARSTVVVPAMRAQATVVRSTPLQRRAGLATLVVPVAGGGTTPAMREQSIDRLRALAAAIIAATPGDERRERARVRAMLASAR